jgi:hypothetical protein
MPAPRAARRRLGVLACAVAVLVPAGCASRGKSAAPAGPAVAVVTNDLGRTVMVTLCERQHCPAGSGQALRPSATASFPLRTLSPGDQGDLLRLVDGAATHCVLLPPAGSAATYTYAASRFVDPCDGQP